MNKLSKDSDLRKTPETPRVICDAQCSLDKAALSDDEPESVSAAGEMELTVIFPYVLPGDRENRDNTDKNEP